MDKSYIENQLTGLYEDLEKAQKMSDEVVCDYFNVDFRKEAVDCLNEEIDFYESKLSEIEEKKQPRPIYQQTADNPYICW